MRGTLVTPGVLPHKQKQCPLLVSPLTLLTQACPPGGPSGSNKTALLLPLHRQTACLWRGPASQWGSKGCHTVKKLQNWKFYYFFTLMIQMPGAARSGVRNVFGTLFCRLITNLALCWGSTSCCGSSFHYMCMAPGWAEFQIQKWQINFILSEENYANMASFVSLNAKVFFKNILIS